MTSIKNANRTRRGPAAGTALAFALFYFIYIIAAQPAFAIPEGGASPDTPGTYAEASPKELKPGETIQFSVSGYPAGEILNIKIDDGAGYSDQTTEGTGVLHTQVIGGNGSASGSFRLPGDISEGWHWLRFLASEQVEGKGALGYTNGAGSASNTGHPTAFQVKGESVGGTDASASVVSVTHPGTNTVDSSSSAQTDAAAATSETNESTTKDSDASKSDAKSSGDGSKDSNKKSSASASENASDSASETVGTDEPAVASDDAAAVVADGAVMTDSEAAKAANDAIFEGGGSASEASDVSGVIGAPAAASDEGGLPTAGIIALAATVAAALAAMIFAVLRKPKAPSAGTSGNGGAESSGI